MKKEFSNSSFEALTTLSKLAVAVDLKLAKNSNASLRLTLKDKDQNSLKTFIQSVDQNYEQLEAQSSSINY